MTIIKLFSRPITWRNLSKFTSHISSYHLSQVGSIEVGTKTSSPENVSDMDKLLTELNGPFSQKSLIVLESNKDIINGAHIIAAINSYLRLYKKLVSDPSNSKSSLTEEESFKKLCTLINSNVGKLSGSEAVKISEYLTRVKVPDSSLVTQSILRRIENSINDLSIVDLSLASKFIKKMPRTPLIIKLKKNLSKKFITKITSEFEENNIDHICHALSFTSNNYSPPKQGQLLEIFLEKLENYKEDISSRNLVIIFETLYCMKWHPKGWISILQNVQDEMILNADEFNSGQILYVLYMIGDKVTKESRNHVFYNEYLVNLFVQKLINEDVGFETGLSALKSLSYIRHKSKELLNYCCASYFERSVMNDQEIKDSEGKLLTLVSGLSAANHKSIFWKDIQNVFTNNDNILKYTHKTLAILAANLIILDFYPTSILEKVFDGQYDYSEDEYLQWTIAKIYQSIKTKPNYNGPFPTESQIKSLDKKHENFIKHRQHVNLPLEKYLVESLGGSQYIVSNAGTKLYHNLDHIVCFNKDKIPVAINFPTNIDDSTDESKPNYVEDLVIPSDCKIITVCLFPNHWYFRNCNEILGIHKLYQDTLEEICSLVAVQAKTWVSLSEEDKCTYLIKELQSKL